jgi:NAD(P)-dependent dehydrogenase (short-subunit alcohol dehydrogenase family)
VVNVNLSNEFKGKVILITGGSSGVGKVTAEKFSELDAEVYICGRSLKKLNKSKEEFKMKGLKINTIEGDVSQVDDCNKVVNHVIDDAGRLDVLVNCAGVYVEGNTIDMSEETWDYVIDINLKGTFFMSKYSIPHLESSKGSIINVSSDSGLIGNAYAAVYCASKGGVTLLTKSMALELAEKEIRVNAVCPGEIDTPMFDDYVKSIDGLTKDKAVEESLKNYPKGTKRIVHPEEVAESILFLASPKVEAITGACLSIDFGLTAGY